MEQLAWRVQGGDSAEGRRALDARQLLGVFESTIDNLKQFSGRMEEKIGSLERGLVVELKSHGKRVADLQEMNKVCVYSQEMLLIRFFSEIALLFTVLIFSFKFYCFCWNLYVTSPFFVYNCF